MVAHKDTLEVKKNGIGLNAIQKQLRFKILALDVKDKNYLNSYRQRHVHEYCDLEHNYFVFSADMLWCVSKCIGGKDEAEKKINFYSSVKLVNEFHEDIDIIISENRVKIDFAFEDYSNDPIEYGFSALDYLQAIYYCCPSEFVALPKANSVKIEMFDHPNTVTIHKPAKEIIKSGYDLDYESACLYAVVSYFIENLRCVEKVTDAEKWYHHYAQNGQV